MSSVKHKLLLAAIVGITAVSVCLPTRAYAINEPIDGGGSSQTDSAASTSQTQQGDQIATNAAPASKYHCGGSQNSVEVSINIGCRGLGNPILDMLFAFIRFLSYGVGIVIVGSLILAGIQYTTSAGDPQQAAKAIGRVRETAIALMLFIFAYPLLNYILPSGFLK